MTKQKNHRLLLGGHMSIAGGFEQAVIRGESIGCTAIQIFTKSNRQWQAKEITQDAINLFEQTLKNSPISQSNVVTHATYLINIGSPDKEIGHKSAVALAEELNRCHQLGIPYLVLHPGSHVDSGEQACLERIAHNLDKILTHDTGKTTILLENMAGQGSTVGYTFDQLATIRSGVSHKKRIGFCFDTCHAFASGYNFRTPTTYKAMWEQFDAIIGLEHLKAIHLNDSKKELGSRVDRHEEIGKGMLGLEPFKLLFNDPRFFDIPKILETPKDTLEDYAHNMKVLKNLISHENRAILGMDK